MVWGYTNPTVRVQGSSVIERTPASAPPVTLKTWSRRPPRAVSVWSAPSTNKRLYRMHFARRLRSPTRIHVSFCGSFFYFSNIFMLMKNCFPFSVTSHHIFISQGLKMKHRKNYCSWYLKLFTILFFSLVSWFSLTLRAKNCTIKKIHKILTTPF